MTRHRRDLLSPRALAALSALAASSLLAGTAATPPWTDRAKAPEERARLLTAEMTLEEKADELLIHFVNEPELHAAFTNRLARGRSYGAIMHISGARQARELQELKLKTSRLKIPFAFHHDVTHGYRTVLPVGLGTASSWNTIRAGGASARRAARSRCSRRQ